VRANATTVLATVAGLGALAAGAYFLAGQQPEAPPKAPPPTAAAPTPPPNAPAPAAAAPLPERGRKPAAPAGRPDQLALPDGTFVATLNGATDVPPLGDYWGNWPWSPIVGVERSSAGLDWYKHADGSFSTTQMAWSSTLKAHVPMTRVAHPSTDTAPVAPGQPR
jgi:hypothetical protein